MILMKYHYSFIFEDFNKRKRRNKVESTFSDLINILFGVPKESVIGSLLSISFKRTC